MSCLGNALNEGKSCTAAIGEAILNVPGCLPRAPGTSPTWLGSIQGLGDAINFEGVFECGGCAIWAEISEFFGNDCDDEPSSEGK